MTKVKEVLHVVCLALMAFILLIVAAHVRSWVHGIDDIIGSAKQAAAKVALAADTSNLVSTESLNLVGSSVQLVNHTTTTVDEVNRSVKQFSVTLQHLSASVDTLTEQGQQTMDNFDGKVNVTSDHLMLAIDEIPVTLKSAQGTFDHASGFISGPLTDSMHSIDTVTKPTGLLMADFQIKTHEWLFPAKQSKWVKTYHFIRGVAPFVQPTYYGVRIYNGD